MIAPRTDDSGKASDPRGRREILIILGLLVVIGLLFFFQTHISTWKVEIPFPNNVLIISLIGLNILLVLLVVFLILRNVVKLLFERKKKVLGSRLRTKLVFSFIALALVPTILLFFIATVFITSSIENLFSGQVEKSLQESLIVAQIYYQNTSRNTLYLRTANPPEPGPAAALREAQPGPNPGISEGQKDGIQPRSGGGDFGLFG